MTNEENRIRRLELLVVELFDIIKTAGGRGFQIAQPTEELLFYLACEDQEDYVDTWKEILAWSKEDDNRKFENTDELGPEEEWGDEEDD